MAAALQVALHTSLFSAMLPQVQKLRSRPQDLGNFNCVCQSGLSCTLAIGAIERRYQKLDTQRVRSGWTKREDWGFPDLYLASLFRADVRLLLQCKLGSWQAIIQIGGDVQDPRALWGGTMKSGGFGELRDAWKRAVKATQPDYAIMTIPKYERARESLEQFVVQSVALLFDTDQRVSVVGMLASVPGHAISLFACASGDVVVCDPNRRRCMPWSMSDYPDGVGDVCAVLKIEK